MAVTDILSQIIKFTLTASTTQSLYYSQITLITAVKITAVQFSPSCQSFASLNGCVIMVFVHRTKQRERDREK